MVFLDNWLQIMAPNLHHVNSNLLPRHGALSTLPYHRTKANGKVESAVKRAKRMLRKTSKSGDGQYLALLNIRNTPTQGVASSPAQHLLGRRIRACYRPQDRSWNPEAHPASMKGNNSSSTKRGSSITTIGHPMTFQP